MRSVALWGCHSAGDVPIPEGAETWSLNGCRLPYRIDRMYELHRLSDRPWRGTDYLTRLEDIGAEVWTFFPDQFPFATKTYPVLEVLEKFPAYHTNSVSWMIAHALLEGVDELWVYGLHFEMLHERLLERPCTEFWLGLAQGMGVKVHVPPRSPLLKSRGLYGLEDSLHNVSLAYRKTTPGEGSARSAMAYGLGNTFPYTGIYVPPPDYDPQGWHSTNPPTGNSAPPVGDSRPPGSSSPKTSTARTRRTKESSKGSVSARRVRSRKIV